jgi:alkylation response protein AidB-like acyl-CoA dehydrogenase
MALPIPEEYGGGGMGYDGYVLVMEQIARVNSSVQMLMAAHILGMSIIATFGTDAQKAEFLPRGVTGEEVFSFAFTEPATGSDPKQITATATKDGDYYLLNGTKRFITNANYPGMLGCVFKETESDKLTTFVLPKDTPGYSWSEPWRKMSRNGGSLLDIYFKDCRVPASSMLGEVGDAFHHLTSGIGYGKMGIASGSLGCMQKAYELSVEYASNKMHRGESILKKFQGVQILIAQMATKVEASRWLLYRNATEANITSKGDFHRFAKDAAMAKTFCANNAVDVTRLAMELHGSYGLMVDYKVEKLYREATFGPVVEGVSHMQDVIIANAIRQGY